MKEEYIAHERNFRRAAKYERRVHMNKRIKKKQAKLKNKKLCKRYPFLIIRDWRTDKPIDFEFTYLNDMPDGWRKAFGEQMCEEIREVLIKGNYLNDYRIAQIKEKFGALRWYDEGVPESIYRELQDIIYKYEEISARTCFNCGKPATKISMGWIIPFCDECADKLSERVKFKNIEEYL